MSLKQCRLLSPHIGTFQSFEISSTLQDKLLCFIAAPVAGLATAAFSDDVLDLEQVALQDAQALEPCSLPGYGVFGAPAPAASSTQGGYGGYGTPGGYGGGYGSAPGRYGQEEQAAAAHENVATAAGFLQSQHCLPLSTQGRLLGVGGISSCKVGLATCAHIRADIHWMQGQRRVQSKAGSDSTLVRQAPKHLRMYCFLLRGAEQAHAAKTVQLLSMTVATWIHVGMHGAVPLPPQRSCFFPQ